MDQTRAINALAPFIALAKSANSPRAAADLVTQATSAANTFVFAELLQHPNIQALAGHEQYGGHFKLLQHFAWDTWESYKSAKGLPQLSDPQARKLRLLSLLTIASQKRGSSSVAANLSYQSLCTRLDLSSPIDLEHLVTEAIYNNLITGTLNPASQTVVITSVAPLRDLAPGSVRVMIAELQSWSERCDSVLADLDTEIKKVKAGAEKRARREAKAERQIKTATDAAEKLGGGAGGGAGPGLMGSSARPGQNTRGPNKREQANDDNDDYEDAMEIDGGRAGGRKKSGGGSGLLSRLTRGSGGRG